METGLYERESLSGGECSETERRRRTESRTRHCLFFFPLSTGSRVIIKLQDARRDDLFRRDPWTITRRRRNVNLRSIDIIRYAAAPGDGRPKTSRVRPECQIVTGRSATINALQCTGWCIATSERLSSGIVIFFFSLFSCRPPPDRLSGTTVNLRARNPTPNRLRCRSGAISLTVSRIRDFRTLPRPVRRPSSAHPLHIALTCPAV
jgi:hypothetical protein